MKKAGLIGYPLKHSISPAMHNAAFKHLGIPCEYSLLELSDQTLRDKVAELRSEEYIGFNVTIPFKEEIIPLLDEDPKGIAKIIGAVNTVKNDHGKLIGYNTDAPGFLAALKEDAGFNPTGKRAFIIGAGGAARAITISLLNAGIEEIIITEAVIEKAENMVNYLNALASNKAKTALTTKEIFEALEKCDLLVNASPIGMHPYITEMPLKGFFDGKKSYKNLLVYDLVYNPYETKLMKELKKAGAKVPSGIGLGMLIRQGALAFEIFTGRPAPYQVMKEAAYQALHLS